MQLYAVDLLIMFSSKQMTFFLSFRIGTWIKIVKQILCSKIEKVPWDHRIAKSGKHDKFGKIIGSRAYEIT